MGPSPSPLRTWLASPLDSDDRSWEVVATIVLLCLVSMAAAYRLWSHFEFMKGLTRELLRSIRQCGPNAACESAVELRIREECQRRSLQRADLLLVLFNLALPCQLCFYLLSITMGLPVLNSLQAAVSFAFFSVNSFFSLSPRLVTPRTVDFIYIYNTLSGVAYVLLQDLDPIMIHNSRVYAMVMALYLGFFDLKPWLNALGVLAMAAAEITMLVLTGSGWMSAWAAYALLLGVLVSAHMILTRSARLEIVGGDAGNELTAVKTLLGSICDVILQLDAGLHLKEHSPKLADTLLHGAGRNYKGVDLRSFLASEEDREIFTRNMEALTETGPAQADVFHAKMKDGTGAPIDMEFFSVAFRGQDAATHRYLGMREYTDITPLVRELPLPDRDAVLTLPKERPATAYTGTPAVHEQADLQSHDGSSQRGGARRAESSDGGGSAGGRSKKAADAIDTLDLAKETSIGWALMGWKLRQAAAAACCPKHAAVAELRRLLPKLEDSECRSGFGPLSKWQCRTCGICCEEWRNRKNKDRCLLCEDWSEGQLRRAQGAASPTALAI